MARRPSTPSILQLLEKETDQSVRQASSRQSTRFFRNEQTLESKTEWWRRGCFLHRLKSPALQFDGAFEESLGIFVSSSTRGKQLGIKSRLQKQTTSAQHYLSKWVLGISMYQNAMFQRNMRLFRPIQPQLTTTHIL